MSQEALTMPWGEIITAVVTGTLTLAGVALVQDGERAKRKASREETLERRMDKLEGKLDRVQTYLREEQRFSHRLVLIMQTMLHYINAAARYRETHADDLPGSPPPLPDAAEIEALLRERPTYDARDDPIGD